MSPNKKSQKKKSPPEKNEEHIARSGERSAHAPIPENLADHRRDYTAAELHRSDLQENPVTQFTHWLGEARNAGLIDATAMALSTVDNQGQPHSRIVLLKKCDASGFTFYTSRDSDKGSQLAANSAAALLFYWRELERQVRIEGTVIELPDEDADDYFYSRPEGSRFSAAASHQSTPVHDRRVLEQAVSSLRKSHPDGNVPRPVNWGGYLIEPWRLEFWQGRADRLHDRFCYEWRADSSWHIDRLSP